MCMRFPASVVRRRCIGRGSFGCINFNAHTLGFLPNDVIETTPFPIPQSTHDSMNILFAIGTFHPVFCFGESNRLPKQRFVFDAKSKYISLAPDVLLLSFGFSCRLMMMMCSTEQPR